MTPQYLTPESYESLKNTFVQIGTDVRQLKQQAKDVANVVTNVQSYGAYPQAEDCTAQVQAAIDATPSGVIYFPSGTYNVATLHWKPGLTFLGVAGASILKKIASSQKFSRMFDVPLNAPAGPSLQSDSPYLQFENLIFDGNRSQHGAYTDFQLEHSHLIFLAANPANPGRLRVRVNNCLFRECVADGLSVYTNVDLQYSNLAFENTFRGGLVIIGGYSSVQGTNLRHFHTDSSAPRTLNIEVDGKGYGDTYDIYVNLQNSVLVGDMTISTQGGFVGLNNVRHSGGDYVSSTRNTTVRITDGTIQIGANDSFTNRMIWPSDFVFSNVNFTLTQESTTHAIALEVYWSVQAEKISNGNLRFVQCQFDAPGQTNATAINSLNDPLVNNNKISFIDCFFGGTLKYGIRHRGNYLLVQGGQMWAETAFYMDIAYQASGREFWVMGMVFAPTVIKYAHIVSHDPSEHYYSDVRLTNQQNIVSSEYGIGSTKYQGSRIITGVSQPNNTPGFVGDIYLLQVPGSTGTWRWVCTTSSHTAATWRADNYRR